MKKKITIEYNWECSSGEVKESHKEALDESAVERISEMMAEGFCEGDLHDNITMDDDDPKDGVEYTGYWKVKKEDVAA